MQLLTPRALIDLFAWGLSLSPGETLAISRLGCLVRAGLVETVILSEGGPLAAQGLRLRREALPQLMTIGATQPLIHGVQQLSSHTSRDPSMFSDETARELAPISSWSSQAPRVRQMLGSSASENRGISCLFHGVPGTGKTAAAQAIAHAQSGLRSSQSWRSPPTSHCPNAARSQTATSFAPWSGT